MPGIAERAARLREDYVLQMPRAAQRFLELLNAAGCGDGDADRTLRKLAHQYAGSGGSYGFEEITVAARGVERASADQLQAQVLGLVDLLNQTFERFRAPV